MFPETYGRTLEELAFLFEDRALADEATKKVEKQMEFSERGWERDGRLSWDMDVIVPGKVEERRGSVAYEVRGEGQESGGNTTAIRGETGRWWER
jgi:hypothetical protein